MGTRPLSIIVPIYGVEKYLRQCVDSILAQTFRDFEVLLIDDGSKDGCPAICDEYAAKDRRVRTIHKENGGYSSAVNMGLDEARGNWIGIIEPDDWIDADMYQRLMNASEKGSLDVVKAGFQSFVGDETRVMRWRTHDASGFVEEHPSIWSCIYRREFLETNRIRLTEVPGAAWTDNLFMLQTMCWARGIEFVDFSPYHYRCRSWDSIKELKDYRIPLDRSIEMLEWLRMVDEKRINIWTSICRRIGVYVYFSSVKVPLMRTLDFAYSVSKIIKLLPHPQFVEGNLQAYLIHPKAHAFFVKFIKYPRFAFPVRFVLRLIGRGDLLK